MNGPLRRRRALRPRGGFTYVEAIISVGLMCAVVGAFAVALDSGMDVFVTACIKGVVGSRVNAALDRLAQDLRETGSADVTVCCEGLDGDECSVALPSFRDADGTFHVTASLEPATQGVVVYCPFETDGGVRQLRRYVFYDTSYVFPFEFTGSPPITDDSIYLRDSLGQTLTVDRAAGNTSLPAGRAFQVFCPGMAAVDVDPGSPTHVVIQATCLTRKGVDLIKEGERYVAHRN
ncbi:MAG: hypothetical protein R6V58_01985 [Planctomycetota bacterium]